MPEKEKTNREYDVQINSYLDHNSSILTIIGIFGALSFFSINDTNEDIRLISVFLSIIVIFLFLIVLYDGLMRIWHSLKENFENKDFFNYIAKSVKSFNLIVFLTMLSGFILLYGAFLNLHEKYYFRILLLLIVFAIVVIIWVITIPYILFKENRSINVGMIWVLTLLMFLVPIVIYRFFDPNFLTPIRGTDDLISLRSFIIILLMIPSVIWVFSFIKLLILFYREWDSIWP